jgi:hypothetical protein
MRKQIVALVLSVALAASGCAHATAVRQPEVPSPSSAAARAEIADYVRHLPPGSRIRVERQGARAIRGTLMLVRDDVVIVQANTRAPEPPVEIPIETITRVTIDQGTGIGKAVAIGAAVGAGATFGFFLLLAALLSD